MTQNIKAMIETDDELLARKSISKKKIILRIGTLSFLIIGYLIIVLLIMLPYEEVKVKMIKGIVVSIIFLPILLIVSYIYIIIKFKEIKKIRRIELINDEIIILDSTGKKRVDEITRIDNNKDINEYSIWIGPASNAQIIVIDKTIFTESLIQELARMGKSIWYWKSQNENPFF